MGKLSAAFETNPGSTAGQKQTFSDNATVIKKSLAIIKAIDKLKAQGIPVTKKAELDYLLALHFLEKNGVDVTPGDDEPEPEIKRNPDDYPEEFETALTFSRQTVAEVETLLRQGQRVPAKKLEEYELCKKFLKKYTNR
ncbi:MAG: hypothetical protein ACM3SY_04630 [Candidatus Omnitrophota bacterium]